MTGSSRCTHAPRLGHSIVSNIGRRALLRVQALEGLEGRLLEVYLFVLVTRQYVAAKANSANAMKIAASKHWKVQ